MIITKNFHNIQVKIVPIVHIYKFNKKKINTIHHQNQEKVNPFLLDG